MKKLMSSRKSRSSNSARGRWIVGLIVLLTIAFIVGLGLGLFAAKAVPLKFRESIIGVLPQALLRKLTLRHYASPIAVAADQVSDLLSITTQQDLEQSRTSLRNRLNGGRCLHDPQATSVGRVTDFVDYGATQHLVSTVHVELPYGFEARAAHIKSRHSGNTLLLYQTGHGGQQDTDGVALASILESGIDVVVLDLPLAGRNNQPVVGIPRIGKVRITTHDQLRVLSSDDFNPMILFLEPVACLVNYFARQADYERFVQVGVSGGGYIATVSAALDPRIAATYSVAGQVPAYLRFQNPTSDWGDFEQVNETIHGVVSDLDLYVMASYGDGREYIQIFKELDPCCYRGRGFESYLASVEQRLRSIGAGRFEVWTDDTEIARHGMSRAMTKKIIQSISADD